MIEVIKIVSGYLACGALWALWFEWFCKQHKIGGPFLDRERYAQLLFWPLNLGVFLYTWITEFFKDNDNGGPSSY